MCVPAFRMKTSISPPVTWSYSSSCCEMWKPELLKKLKNRQHHTSIQTKPNPPSSLTTAWRLIIVVKQEGLRIRRCIGRLRQTAERGVTLPVSCEGLNSAYYNICSLPRGENSIALLRKIHVVCKHIQLQIHPNHFLRTLHFCLKRKFWRGHE